MQKEIAESRLLEKKRPKERLQGCEKKPVKETTLKEPIYCVEISYAESKLCSRKGRWKAKRNEFYESNLHGDKTIRKTDVEKAMRANCVGENYGRKTM